MAEACGRALDEGPGRVLAVLYAVFAIAATGRSAVQISLNFSQAPLAYLLSALAAVVYVIATVCFVRGDRARRAAWLAVGVEMAGVLLVGAASYAVPSAFPDKTVWSHFGQGYGFVPLLLPMAGLWWLRVSGRSRS